MTVRVGTLNEQKDLNDTTAAADLDAWLRHDGADIVGLNEWTPDRNGILNGLEGYAWARPPEGGPVALWRVDRYTLKSCRGHELVGEQFVGRLPGRKSTLPPSIATVARLLGNDGEKVALVVVHLTAEVQDRFGDYHDDDAHRLRVRRHRRERRHLRRLVRKLRRRGWKVYVVGDTNFDSMRLPPLISCWEGKPHRGTLGGRCVDYVYGEQPAGPVRLFDGHSDHKGVVAIYP